MGRYMNKIEYNILSFYLTRVLFMGGGFSLLVNVCHNNLLISSFLGMLLGYFLLFLIYKKGNINKIMKIIISLVILIINIIGVTALTSTHLLFKTPSIIVVIALVLVLLYGSKKDIKNIGWIAFILIFISSFIVGIACLNLFRYTKLTNLLPLFDTGVMDFIKGIIIFAGTSTLPNVLLIEYKGNMKFKDISIGYIIGALLMILVLFFINGTYGYEFASILRFPEYSILRNIDLFNFLTNIENIFMLEWISCIIVCGLLCFKVLRNNTKPRMFYTIISLLVFGIYTMLIMNYPNVLYVKEYFYYLFSLLMLLVLLIKKEKSK